MSNIRAAETGRHRWVEDVKAFSGEAYGRAGMKPAFLCKNCGIHWVDGSPPVAGCKIEVDVRQLGPSQFKEYTHEGGRI